MRRLSDPSLAIVDLSGVFAPESRDPFQSGEGAYWAQIRAVHRRDRGFRDRRFGDRVIERADEVQAACESGESGSVETIQGQILNSQVVDIEFDEDAEAKGFWDCSYARSERTEPRGYSLAV